MVCAGKHTLLGGMGYLTASVQATPLCPPCRLTFLAQEWDYCHDPKPLVMEWHDKLLANKLVPEVRAKYTSTAAEVQTPVKFEHAFCCCPLNKS